MANVPQYRDQRAYLNLKALARLILEKFNNSQIHKFFFFLSMFIKPH